MGYLKFISGTLLIFLGIYVFSKGFYMPNSSAAELFFGIGLLIALGGFVLWSK